MINFFALFITCSIFSCASQKTGIKVPAMKDSALVVKDKSSAIPIPVSIILHNEAFFTVTAGGTQMINENGDPVSNFTIDRFLILESEEKSIPKIASISYEDRKYKVESISSQDNAVIGKKFTDGKSVLIKSNYKNTLWKIKVLPADGKEDSKTALHNIVVKGSVKDKPFSIKIPGETELQGEMRY